ncbi:PAAR domain-containing protein [Paraburkholderia sp. SIMBA_030]|uniref:PAAR domain-containing protein n=1 Tax=Paraburkholderia sp. SIMBA_030 TaxID=3085773 RepID=UPI00397C5ED8
MRKAAVRDGDPTTTGGYVIGTSTRINDKGKKVALTDDHATCGNCKGTYRIFGTGKGLSDMKRAVVVDGDSVLCPCGKNQVIVGSNPGIWLEAGPGAGRTKEPNTVFGDTSAASTLVTFDEQLRAAGAGASEGFPYFIELADGRTFSGRLDSSCALPRMTTGANADDYTVHWGDQALVKLNED